MSGLSGARWTFGGFGLALVMVACSGGHGAASDGGATSDDAGAAVDASDASPTDAGIGYPAFKPAMPQLQKGALTPMAKPVVVNVYFNGETLAAQVDDATSKWVGSSHFTDAVKEYGVISGSTASSIALTEDAAATLTTADIETWLKGKFDGTHPEVGAVDAATLGSKIFVLYYPAATKITADGGNVSCVNFTGFHLGVTLASGAVVSYLAIPRCMPTAPQTQTEELVLTASGLIVSAATNPVTSAMPTAGGYSGFDQDHSEWAAGGSDVGTACEGLAPVKLSDIGVTVARTWSNAAALAYHDPCIPTPDSQPYFVAAPVQTDDFTVFGTSGKGVKVPKGGSAKVPIQLLSEAPTSGAWSVTATNLQSQSLDLSVAPMSGQNGDVLELTITDKGKGVGSLFVVTSTLGARKTLWYGYAFVK